MLCVRERETTGPASNVSAALTPICSTETTSSHTCLECAAAVGPGIAFAEAGHELFGSVLFVACQQRFAHRHVTTPHHRHRVDDARSHHGEDHWQEDAWTCHLSCCACTPFRSGELLELPLLMLKYNLELTRHSEKHRAGMETVIARAGPPERCANRTVRELAQKRASTGFWLITQTSMSHPGSQAAAI
jgi:hypothetical protein